MPGLTPDAPIIHRHRTAMVRHDLSQPMGLLVRHGLINAGVEVFDYGCGQGDDLRILEAAGVKASGWDPYFKPNGEMSRADVVNLGFVLNVIEQPSERLDALRSAWSLARRTLAVATMVTGQVSTTGLTLLGDGFATRRGTFQKYYAQAELQALIHQTLGVQPVAVAPGIFFVFRNPEDEQDFVFERRAGRRRSAAGYRIARPGRQSTRAVRPGLEERIPAVLAEIRSFALERGRSPQADELSAISLDALAQEAVSFTRALNACLEDGLDRDAMEAAANARREDLVVHYAMALLSRSASASRPSPGMVRDIRALFGSQKQVSVQATEYLKALADEDLVRKAAHDAAAEGLGLLDSQGRFYVLGDRAEALSGVLRCYIGCGAFLSGEPVGTFVLRIDAGRRRITMWPLGEFASDMPLADLRIQTDLRRQEVTVRPDLRRLIRKGQLLGLPPRARLRQAEQRLRETNPFLENAVFEALPDPTMRGA